MWFSNIIYPSCIKHFCSATCYSPPAIYCVSGRDKAFLQLTECRQIDIALLPLTVCQQHDTAFLHFTVGQQHNIGLLHLTVVSNIIRPPCSNVWVINII
jgi:hypothetical protein